jgi:uncharacterized protein with NRDE domain
MCLLALLYRVTSDAAIVVAANREEFYERGGEPPRRLEGVAAVGGVDPAHGGTWLGVNAHGLLVAVTNRPKSQLPAAPRSRGLLARELLGNASAAEAVQHAARALDSGAYAGCNFLCVDEREAVVIHAGDWLRIRPLPPGVHVLSNRDVNDPSDRRVVHAAGWLSGQDLSTSRSALNALARLCGSHEPPDAPMCFRREKRGSVSSSLLALRAPLARSTYLHAQGPPDCTPYVDVSELLRALASSGAVE